MKSIFYKIIIILINLWFTYSNIRTQTNKVRNLNSSPNSIACETLKCLSCEDDPGICTKCVVNYLLYIDKNVCVFINNCNDINCNVCEANQNQVYRCKTCYSGNKLDDTGVCVIDKSGIIFIFKNQALTV